MPTNLQFTDPGEEIEFLTNLLDSKFNIFGIKIGIDPIIGLLPGVGGAISMAISGYILYLAYQLRIPNHKLAKMLAVILLDFLIGSIPIAGTIFDVFYRANTRNLKIIKDHLLI